MQAVAWLKGATADDGGGGMALSSFASCAWLRG